MNTSIMLSCPIQTQQALWIQNKTNVSKINIEKDKTIRSVEEYEKKPLSKKLLLNNQKKFKGQLITPTEENTKTIKNRKKKRSIRENNMGEEKTTNAKNCLITEEEIKSIRKILIGLASVTSLLIIVLITIIIEIKEKESMLYGKDVKTEPSQPMTLNGMIKEKTKKEEPQNLQNIIKKEKLVSKRKKVQRSHSQIMNKSAFASIYPLDIETISLESKHLTKSNSIDANLSKHPHR